MSHPPIFVVSKGHPQRVHTFKWLNTLGLPYTVVVHTRAQATQIMQLVNDDVDIVITKKEYLFENRNFILRNLVKKGQWYIGMDDNIQRINKVSSDYYGKERVDGHAKPKKADTWRQVYRTDATRELLALMHELINECNLVGTTYGGFASMENPFFRMRHWSYRRFVKSKLYVMRNDGQRFQGIFGHDSRMSVETVVKYGCVAVNNFVHPVHKMYEQGGLGHITERRPILNKHLNEIVKQYPGLVQIGHGANTALRFRITSDAGLTKWRAEHGYPPM